MSESKFVAIGDIHGCSKTLELLLDKLRDHKDRTFVFLGDYVDRGPDSKSVVQQIINFDKKYHCVFLRGNHEQMLLDAIYQGDMDLWMLNGGNETVRSYKTRTGRFVLPVKHEDFYSNTLFFYDTNSYFFVHAGLKVDMTVKENIEASKRHADFLWERSHLRTNDNKWEKTVVFGHTPEPAPHVGKNMIGIDTGCVYRQRNGFGKLTAVLLPEVKFVQQECID